MVTEMRNNGECYYEKGCGITDGSGYRYLCDIHRHEDDELQVAEEARRHDAHIELLRRVDDPNDYFNEDDLDDLERLQLNDQE